MVILPVNTAFANQTHKINEEISFGRTYEFDEPVTGTVIISGAKDEIIPVGNAEEKQLVDKVSILSKFTPNKLGIYKLNIEVNVTNSENKDLSKRDVVYFVVTNDGREMTGEEVDKYLLEIPKDQQSPTLEDYQNRPYIKSLTVENAQLEGELNRDQFDYVLKINDNTQNITFKAEPGSDNVTIDGSMNVNPNEQNINMLSVSNGKNEVIYTFKWKKPKIKVFNYKTTDGKNLELVYDFSERFNFSDSNIQEIEITGEKFKVFEDENGNLLIPLRELDSEKGPDLYTFSTDGEILKKFDNFVNLNSQTFRQEEYKKIFAEDLVLFNLEEVEISKLNYAKGYKINRTGYENQYLVNLTRPDGITSWYQYDDNQGVEQLIQLTLPSFITEKDLAEFFGVDIDLNYNKFQYSYYDLALVAVAIISLVIIIIGSIVNAIKKAWAKRKNK